MEGAALEDPTLLWLRAEKNFGHQVSAGSWIQVGPVRGVMTDGGCRVGRPDAFMASSSEELWSGQRGLLDPGRSCARRDDGWKVPRWKTRRFYGFELRRTLAIKSARAPGSRSVLCVA